MSLVYSSPLAPKLSEEALMFARMSNEQRERRVEEDIRSLAKLDSLIPSNLQSTQHIRRRRDDSSNQQKTNSSILDYVEISQNVEVNYGPDAKAKIQREDEDYIQPETDTDNCITNNTACNPLKPPTTTHKIVKDKSKSSEERSNEEEEELPKFEVSFKYRFKLYLGGIFYKAFLDFEAFCVWFTCK